VVWRFTSPARADGRPTSLPAGAGGRQRDSDHVGSAPVDRCRRTQGMDADKAYLMVRAQVANAADREKFDHWYATQHVPMAMDRFRCEKAWRMPRSCPCSVRL